MRKRAKKRTVSGQGLIEGAVSVCLIIAASIGAVLFILNSGSGMFFKEKLAYASHLAANYAAAHAGDSDVESETSIFVEALMPQMGLSPSNLEVEVNEISVQENNGFKVTVTNSFPLFGGGSGGLMPAFMRLSDTEVVVW
jgi:hypothetical protein